jgi:hypothetical protein
VPAGTFVPINPPPIQPVQVGGVTVTPPQFLVGQAVNFQGVFHVNTAAGAAGNGFAAILQQSTDNKTWTPAALFSTSSGGGYTFTWSLNQAGSIAYRVFLTGIPQTKITADGLVDPATIQSDLTAAIANHQPLNTTDTGYSSVSYFKVGTLSVLVSAITAGVTAGFSSLSTGITANLNQLQTTLVGQINNVGTSVNTLQTNSASKGDVSSLNSQVSTLTTIAYAALAIAIILGLVAIFLSMRKRS